MFPLLCMLSQIPCFHALTGVSPHLFTHGFHSAICLAVLQSSIPMILAVPSQLVFFSVLPQRRSLRDEKCLDQELWRKKKCHWFEENCILAENSFNNYIKYVSSCVLIWLVLFWLCCRSSELVWNGWESGTSGCEHSTRANRAAEWSKLCKFLLSTTFTCLSLSAANTY